MEPGYNLRTQIAELMGYVAGSDVTGSRIISGPVWIDGEPIWQRENGYPATCPNYPEDIAAAMEVAEKVGKEYPNFVLVWWVGEEDGEWDAGFGCDYEDSWTYEASGETASQAICLAALQTRGIVIK